MNLQVINQNKKVIFAYGGRFQPFHPGHYATYNELVERYGADNVYLVSSFNVNPKIDNYFSIEEKKQIMEMFNIPLSHVIGVKGSPTFLDANFLSYLNLDPEFTSLVTVVGSKDVERFNKKAYMLYNEESTLLPASNALYYLPIEAGTETGLSATGIRRVFQSGNVVQQQLLFEELYGYDMNVFELMRMKLSV